MPRIQFASGWRTCKPAERKYPWGELAVGETRTIDGVSSSASASSSLRKWRDRHFIYGHGLGYDTKCCPLFSIEYDPHRAAVRITRLPDGPLYG